MNKLDALVQQLFVARSDMPAFHLAAQVLIQHRLEKKMIFVADKRYVAYPRQVESGKKAAETAADDDDSCVCHYATSPGWSSLLMLAEHAKLRTGESLPLARRANAAGQFAKARAKLKRT